MKSAVKDELIKIELVGSETYSTLKKAFKKGEVYLVSAAEWAERKVGLMFQSHPTTGAALFARSDKEVTDIPASKTAMTETHSADPAALVGLTGDSEDGTMDTGTGEGVTGNVDGTAGTTGAELSAQASSAPAPARKIIVSGPRNAALKDALPLAQTPPSGDAGPADTTGTAGPGEAAVIV